MVTEVPEPTAGTALPLPLLLVVADLGYVGDEQRWLRALREVSAAALGRPVAVQVRAKQRGGDEWRRLVEQARAAITAGVPAFLNGDTATALALGYEGVHWPEADTPERAPTTETPRWRSAAVHSVDAAARAQRAAADLLVFGSVFAPGSKPGAGVGVEALRAVVSASSVPVVAIGGVEVERVRACLDAGAHGVAVVSGVLGAGDIGAAVEMYVDMLASATDDALPRSGGSR